MKLTPTILVIPILLALTAVAAAQNAYTTRSVNMRIAPGADYPRIATIPANATVTVHGCNRALTWCDTSWFRFRGWVSSRYLEMMYRGRRVHLDEYGPRIGIPIIAFDFGSYWDRHYRHQSWYRDRERWNNHWRRGGDREWRGDRRDPGREREPERERDRDHRERRPGGTR